MNKLKKNKKWRVASGQWSGNKEKLITQHSSLNTGLTLIEVMVVVAILSIITSTLFSVFQGSLLSQRRGTNKALIYSEARAALDMMSREIEKAFVDERIGAHYELWNGNSGYRTITGSIGDEFYFIAPMDNSGIGDLCKVGYWLSTDKILRRYFMASGLLDYATYKNVGVAGGDYNENSNTNSGANALIGNVSDLQFQYWNESTSRFDDPNLGTLGYALPKAVKITLVLEYPMEKDITDTAIFTTVVNIPGSGQ